MRPTCRWERKRRPEVEHTSRTIQNFLARAIRLYEQEPGEPFDSSRLGVYVRRWVRWTGAGLAVADIPARKTAAATKTL